MRKTVWCLFLFATGLGFAQKPVIYTDIQGHSVIDVREHGAKCDGTTDDAVAIQAAIDSSAGVNTVLIPSATCVVGATLTLPTNTSIRGVSSNESILKFNFTVSAAGSYIVVEDATNGNDNITIENLRIEGNGTGLPQIGGSGGIGLRLVENVSITHCQLDRIPGVAISLANAQKVLIHSNVIVESGRGAMLLVSPLSSKLLSDVVISDNIIFRSADDSIAVFASQITFANTLGRPERISITGNTIMPWDSTVADISGTAITVAGVQDVVISGNTISNSTSRGIAVSEDVNPSTSLSSRRVLVNNNTIFQSGFHNAFGVLHGIHIQGSSDVTVAGNVVSAVTGAANGIIVTGSTAFPTENVLVSGNIVVDGTGNSGSFGIHIVAAASGATKSVIVSNNLVKDNNGGGIRSQGADLVYILDNVVQDNGAGQASPTDTLVSGISVTGQSTPPARVVIRGNHVFDTRGTKKQTYGLTLEGAVLSDAVLEGNELFNNETASLNIVSIPTVLKRVNNRLAAADISFEMPTSAAPGTDVFGEVEGDNNAWAASRGALQVYDGTSDTFLVGVQVSDVPTNLQVVKWNTGGTFTFEDDISGGSPTWNTISDPVAVQDLVFGAVAETSTFSYEAAYASGNYHTIRQQTGNTTGGTLLSVTAADAQTTVAHFGDGTNGVEVSQAGAMARVGTGAITATALEADSLDAMSEIAAGIKRGPDATDTHLLTTDVAVPPALRCMQMDTDGSVVLDTDTCSNLGPGGSPTWDSVADPVAVADLVFGAVAEISTFSYEAAYTTGSYHLIRQQTGDTSGGTLFDVRAADAQTTVFRAGDGTNGITVSQAGALTAEGTGAITATLGDSATAFFPAGELEVVRGGTGVGAITGLIQGNTTSNFTAITNSSTVGEVLRVTGAAAYGWGALDLADGDAVTGTLPVGNGGSGVTSPTDGGILVGAASSPFVSLGVATNGQIPIGDGATAPVLATITGGTEITVVNGSGSITVNGDFTPSSTDTLTEKTFDAEASGNVLTVKKYLYYKAAGCQNTTANTGFDLPTATTPAAVCDTTFDTDKVLGVLSFDDTTEEDVTDHFTLPPGFTGNIDLSGYWHGTNVVNEVRWCIQIQCVDTGEQPGSYNSATCADETVNGTADRYDDFSRDNITQTGCSADDELFWRFYRDASVAGDDFVGDADLVSLRFTIRDAQ